jgi:hypothetical protein
LFLGGQHTPFWGGQYAPIWDGHFTPFLGGQFERFFQLKQSTKSEYDLHEIYREINILILKCVSRFQKMFNSFW